MLLKTSLNQTNILKTSFKIHVFKNIIKEKKL